MSEIDQDQGDDGAVEYGPGATSFEEMEEANTRVAPPDLSKITLDSPEIPEEFRGKPITEVIQAAIARKNALEISENARLALQNSQKALEAATNRPAVAPPPPPQPEPELTEEQERELFDRDAFAWNKLQQQKLEKRLLGQFHGAIQPVLGSSADLAINAARSKYPDEFAALGPDIETMISQLPDKAALAAPGAMDEVVNYARGKHVQKYIAYLNSKQGNGLDTARAAAQSQSPLSLPTGPRTSSGRSGPVQLDDIEKQVADALEVSYEDYARNKTKPRGRNG